MDELRFPVRRRLFLTAAAVACASTVAGAAATLGGLQSAGLGAGQSDVTGCDADGVSVTYALTAGAVDSIDVTGIAASCAGGSLRAVLADAAGASIASGGPHVVVGTTVSVAMTPQPRGGDVADVHVVIEGP